MRTTRGLDADHPGSIRDESTGRVSGRMTAPAATASFSRCASRSRMRIRCACDRHPRTDLEFVRPRPGMIDRGDRIRLPFDERPQQRLVGEASAGLRHVREEEVVGVLDACSPLERGAGQRTIRRSVRSCLPADRASPRGDPRPCAARRCVAARCESSPDDDRIEFPAILLRHRRSSSSCAGSRPLDASMSARNRATSIVALVRAASVAVSTSAECARRLLPKRAVPRARARPRRSGRAAPERAPRRNGR